MFGSESRPVFAGYEHAPVEGDKGAPDTMGVATGWNLRLPNLRAPSAQGTISAEIAASVRKPCLGCDSSYGECACGGRGGRKFWRKLPISPVWPNFVRALNSNRLLKIAADRVGIAQAWALLSRLWRSLAVIEQPNPRARMRTCSVDHGVKAGIWGVCRALRPARCDRTF